MKITILTYLDSEESKNYDVVVDQVARALRQGGHTPSILGVHGDLRKLVAGCRGASPRWSSTCWRCSAPTCGATSPWPGCSTCWACATPAAGPASCTSARTRGLAKKALAFDQILYPDFAVFSKDDLETGGNLRLPLFVKPLRTDASIGIGTDSLVHDATSLMKRVATIHETCDDAALAEEYIEGREFYVGILGNRQPRAFPPIEMDFSGLPEGAPRVLDSKAKWAEDSPEYKGTKSVLAELPDELRAKIQKAALDAYRALRVRDYGRVDLRLTDSGEIYVIEVNANCYLEQSGEFASSAAAAGMDYPTLINRIVELAAERHGRGT
jgi:D-alanine-D-alanine ligase